MINFLPHSVCTLSKALDVLQKAGKLKDDMVQRVRDFVAANRFPAISNQPICAGDGAVPEKKTKKVSLLQWNLP